MTNPLIISKDKVEDHLSFWPLKCEIEKSFVALSKKQANVLPVGFLKLPQGETHIKCAYVYGRDFFVVKIASGFFENPKRGLSSSQGTMLVFCAHTGVLLANIHDHGFLTDVRTAITGAIVAELLAPANVECIGILGSGNQAKLQLQNLAYVSTCRRVMVWTRTPKNLKAFKSDPKLSQFTIVGASIEEIAKKCRLIVTTTPSQSPLLFSEQIQAGTHITAVGADDVGKQELDPKLLDRADILLGDSLTQCRQFGELSRSKKLAIELGNLIRFPSQRQPHHITIADLTGVATQDSAIATFVYEKVRKHLK